MAGKIIQIRPNRLRRLEFLGLNNKDQDRVAAIDDGGRSVTYGELLYNTGKILEYLPSNELVFCLCKNNIASLEGYIAFYQNHDVPLLLGANIDQKLLDNLIKVYRPTYLWVPIERKDEFDEYNTVMTWKGYALIETESITHSINEDLAFLMTTSGTTGSPKLVRHRVGNLESSAKNVAEVFGWTVDERSICCLPMNYTMGLSVINSTLHAGGTLLLAEKELVSPEFWKFIKENHATNFTGVPYSYEILLKLRFTRMDLPDLKTLAQGGGKMSDKTFATIAEYAKNTGKRFFATFGTTETTARMAYLPPELATEKIGSIGRAIPEGELYLVDENGEEITEMVAEGELCYKGPNVTLGYAQTRKDLRLRDVFEGEYKTGDIARRDEDGCYYIIGRKGRFLKLFGFRVSLDQSEQIIRNEMDVDCACAGTDECMDIYITDAEKADSVRKFISNKLNFPENAFCVKVVSEIPRNESGKINYKLLNQ